MPFNVSKIRMRPSYRAKWLQLILVAIIITIPPCRAELTPMTRRWETADLIIEGKIIEIRTREGIPESTIDIERILKTDSPTVNTLYFKGHVEGLSIKIPANNLEPHQTHLLFLEQTGTGYNLLYSEKVEDQVNPSISIPGTTGLLALFIITLISSRQMVLTTKKNVVYS
ncbi:hypothetical protein GF326_09170 [Candidatus Bathyarchaeota archaeon]|nr:hypothetical protein [Candidatus Bathyarchaeota archaeon]